MPDVYLAKRQRRKRKRRVGYLLPPVLQPAKRGKRKAKRPHPKKGDAAQMARPLVLQPRVQQLRKGKQPLRLPLYQVTAKATRLGRGHPDAKKRHRKRLLLLPTQQPDKVVAPLPRPVGVARLPQLRHNKVGQRLPNLKLAPVPPFRRARHMLRQVGRRAPKRIPPPVNPLKQKKTALIQLRLPFSKPAWPPLLKQHVKKVRKDRRAVVLLPARKPARHKAVKARIRNAPRPMVLPRRRIKRTVPTMRAK